MKAEEPNTLGEALLWQMARVRDEVLSAYEAVGPAGQFAAMMLKADLDAAMRSIAAASPSDMARAYWSLKRYEV